MPELPLSKYRRYREAWGLSAYDAGWLVAERETAEWFEEAVAQKGDPKAVFNWMSNDFAKLLNEHGLSPRASKVTPAALVDLLGLIDGGSISGKIAKEVFKEMFASGRSASEVVEAKGLTQISDADTIVAAARKAIADHPETVAKYRSGQHGVLGFFVGQVMKETGGRANPKLVQQIVSDLLKESG
jgi:aspartyl-tRNA(Asn)/glutamyl-tRNA(Gln) amidotransferase subunit B